MRKILGFRSGKKWKKVIATVGYLFIALIVVGMFSDNDTKTTTVPVAKTDVTPVVAETKTPEQIAQDKTDAELKAKQETEAKAAAEAKEKADAKAKEIPGTLGLKPNELKDKWNSYASSMNMNDLKISEINVENGQVQDTFTFTFNNTFGLMGSVNKVDGSIRDVTIVASGKGLSNTKTAANVILSWGLLIQTTNPGLSAPERGNILKDLGAIGDNASFKDADKSTVRGNIKYYLKSSDALGIWFGAGDINDGK